MNRRTARRLGGVGRFFVLAFYMLLVLLPIYWLFITSVKSRMEVFAPQITYWPTAFSFQNYIDLFGTTNFPIYLKNSVVVSLITALIVLVFAISGGYALARYKFRGKGTMLIALLVSQMIPATLLLIPTYLIILKLRLNNTLAGLILFYVTTNIPFCLITMRSFFERVPTALEEAARVDGCSQMSALVRIILPVMLPSIVATAVFAFTGAWNELLAAVLFISKDTVKTVPVGLSSFVSKISIDWGQMCAGGVIALLPSVVLFALTQRFIVAGLTAGAVKE